MGKHNDNKERQLKMNIVIRDLIKQNRDCKDEVNILKIQSREAVRVADDDLANINDFAGENRELKARVSRLLKDVSILQEALRNIKKN